MNLTERELATVLAALRYWQSPEMFAMSDIDYFDEHEALTAEEIDQLCERLNVVPV